MDPVWSGQAEGQIKQAIPSGRMAGTKLVGVECRTTICRLDLAHDDQASWERFRDLLPRTLPFPVQGFSHRIEGTDPPEGVVYIARPGHTLPEVPQ